MTAYTSQTLPLDAALQQAIAHHQAGRLQDAERLYRAILQARPNHPDANHNLGILAVQVKQPAAGLPHFKAALESDPNQGQYWLSYIDALIQAGQTATARQVLEQGRQRGLRGEAFDALAGRLVGNARAATQSDAQDPQAAPGTHEIDALVALFNERRYAEAATLAQTMTVHYPLHGFGWKVLGAIFKQMGRNTEALAPMQKAVALSPGDAEAHNNLGVTLKDLARLNGAEASYRRALQLKPDYAEAHNNLGNTLRNLGRLDEATTCCRRALEFKPDYAEAYNNLGITLKELGRLDEAEASYRRVLQIKPDLAETHSNLCSTLKDMCRLVEAEASCRRALQLKPDFAEAHQNLATLLAYLSDFDQVVAESDTALHLKPDDAAGWEQRLYAFSYHPDLTAQEIYEVGVAWGGGMLFEATLLEILGGQKVIGIDIFIPPDLRQRLSSHGNLSERLVLIEGSSTAADILAQVNVLLGGSRKVLVILDSYHTHDHVLNELRSYAPFIEKGQYLICGDTVVERIPAQLHRTRPWGPGNNPATAVKEFLSETDRFVVDEKIDQRLLLSCHPGGYLQAVK